MASLTQRGVTGSTARRSLRRTFLTVTAGLTVAALAAGCSGGDTSDGADEPNGTVAFGHPASSSSIFPLLVAGAQQAADERGYDLLVSAADLDSGAQVDELNTWIAQGVSGVVVSPVDPAAMAPVLARAKENGVVFVGYADDTIEGADGSVLFGNREAGELIGTLAAEWVNENLGGDAKVALFTDEATSIGRDRINGAVDALKEGAPGVEVVASQDAFFADETLPIFQSMLQANPDINVVFCMADDGCIGAEKAFLQTNPSDERKSQMFMAGWDGTLPILKQIASGDSVIRATAVLDIVQVGYDSIEATVNAVEGAGETNIVTPYTIVTEDDPDVANDLIKKYEAILAK